MHHPRTSLNLVTAGQRPLGEALEMARTIGVQAISFSASQFGDAAQASIRAVRDSGMPVVSLGTGGLTLIDSPQQTAERLHPLVALAAQLNAAVAFAVAGPTPSRMATDEAIERLCACLPAIVDAARTVGVRLAVENNGQATRQLGFLQSLDGAFRVCGETGTSLVLELQNCWYESGLKSLFRDNLQHIALVQVSDFRVGEGLAFNRRVPDDGDIPLEWLMGSLLDAGYEGRFELEVLGPAIESEGAEAAMRRGCEWISKRLVGWGV